MAVCDLNGTAPGKGMGKTRIEFERRDLYKIGGLVVAVITLVAALLVPLTAYIFQTRHQALTEHHKIEQTAALAQQELRLRREADLLHDGRVDKSLEDSKKILQTLDINQRTLMREGEIPRRRIKALPAGIDFADVDLETP